MSAAFASGMALPSRPKHATSRGRRAVVYGCAKRPRIAAAIAVGVLSHCLVQAVEVCEVYAEAQSDVITQEEATVVETAEQLRERSQRNSRISGAAAREYANATRLGGMGNFKEAEEAYRRVIEEVPTYAPAHSNLGNVLVARAAFKEAISEYSCALELAPLASDAWLVHVNRGMTLVEEGRLQEALDDLNAADRAAPKRPEVLSNRGYVWEALGKADNALKDYTDAIRGGSVQPFWIRYGLVLFERGRLAEAQGILSRVANTPTFAGDDARAALAVTYFERGLISEAETTWSMVERPRQYEKATFLVDERRWPARAVKAMQRFRSGGTSQ